MTGPSSPAAPRCASNGLDVPASVSRAGRARCMGKTGAAPYGTDKRGRAAVRTRTATRGAVECGAHDCRQGQWPCLWRTYRGGIGRYRPAQYLCLRLTWAPVLFVTIILVFGYKKISFSKSC